LKGLILITKSYLPKTLQKLKISMQN